MFFKPALTNSKPDQKQNSVLFILLGASNLARCFDGLKNCIKRCLSPRPTNFIHAMGPGRGYVIRGGILNATYLPIISCGIFEAIQDIRKPNQKVIALITDIGNDIMYGVPPDKIIGGLQYIFDALGEFETNIYITSIPVDLKNDISEFYFRILRKIFFPKSATKYSQTLKTIEDINKFIHHSSNKNITVISDMLQFCGVDKIHYSLLKSSAAWSYIANNLTTSLAVNSFPKLKVSELVYSLANNLARILFIDMLGIAKKNNETF